MSALVIDLSPFAAFAATIAVLWVCFGARRTPEQEQHTTEARSWALDFPLDDEDGAR